jgi:hypothetical protein
MKKLYSVEITVYVMAEDDDEAKRVAVKNCEEDSAEAWQAKSVAHEWYDAIPFGADDDMKCGEILKLQRAAQPRLQATGKPPAPEANR